MRISTINKKVRRVCTNLVSVGCCDSSNQLIIISPLGKFSTFRLFAGMDSQKVRHDSGTGKDTIVGMGAQTHFASDDKRT